MSDDKRAREDRRRKIRELEASLFGASNTDTQKVDLPELKNVDEYSTKFGRAERQKRYTSPSVDDYLPKKPPTVSKISKSRHKSTKKDDRKNLLSDNDEDDDEENYDASKSLSRVSFCQAAELPVMKGVNLSCFEVSNLTIRCNNILFYFILNFHSVTFSPNHK